jgi:hypothetical protein
MAFHELSSLPKDALLLYPKFPNPPQLSKYIPQVILKIILRRITF